MPRLPAQQHGQCAIGKTAAIATGPVPLEGSMVGGKGRYRLAAERALSSTADTRTARAVHEEP